jgi:RNA polymerase sigma factor (sigma-70 family)
MERSENLEELLGQHYPSALRLARSILREDEEAADAVQSAFGNVLRSLVNFREESSFSTWLSRIVVNQRELQESIHAETVSLNVVPFAKGTETQTSRDRQPHRSTNPSERTTSH